MKYLKRFNESKVLDGTVIEECKDILLELQDKGFKTNINSYLSYEGIRPPEKNSKWIQFFFSRKEEFNYSDIEDVVERLKSFLSEYGLKVQWMSPTERSEQKPTIKTTSVMNPMNFEVEGVRTQCELQFI